VACADNNTLSAFVVCACNDAEDATVRKVVEVVQGVSAQERTVRALIVPVLVLEGLDEAASEHSLVVHM